MSISRRMSLAAMFVTIGLGTASVGAQEKYDLPEPPTATKELEIIENAAHLGGKPIQLWGLRCVHALRERELAERLVAQLDNFTAHGLNLISIYMQPAHGGHPDIQAGVNPFSEAGELDPVFARRLEWVAREADARGMVILLGVITPIKDQELADEAAIQKAIEETARLLETRKIRNVIVDLLYEFDHPTRIYHEIFREPDGAAKKAKVAKWFHAIAPKIEVGVTTETKSKSRKDFEGMDIQLIQKLDPIPPNRYALNIESFRRDKFGDDGIFTPEQVGDLIKELSRYRSAKNVGYVLNSSFAQSIGGPDGKGPHFDMGGYGTGPDDRGMRIYFEWVRDNVGRYQYPLHVPGAR